MNHNTKIAIGVAIGSVAVATLTILGYRYREEIALYTMETVDNTKKTAQQLADSTRQLADDVYESGKRYVTSDKPEIVVVGE